MTNLSHTLWHEISFRPLNLVAKMGAVNVANSISRMGKSLAHQTSFTSNSTLSDTQGGRTYTKELGACLAMQLQAHRLL